MNNLLRIAVERRRAFLIEQLIQMGAYDRNDRQLYDQILSELEMEYRTHSSFR